MRTSIAFAVALAIVGAFTSPTFAGSDTFDGMNHWVVYPKGSVVLEPREEGLLVIPDDELGGIEANLAESRPWPSKVRFEYQTDGEHGMAFAITDEPNGWGEGVGVPFDAHKGGGIAEIITSIPEPRGSAVWVRLEVGVRGMFPELHVRLWFVYSDGREELVEDWRSPTGIEDESPQSPVVATSLTQNAPNPFNPVTAIPFALGRDGPVQLAVFDVAGREIVRLVDEQREAGEYRVVWDGVDTQGIPVPSGVYLYRLITAEAALTRSMLLVK